MVRYEVIDDHEPSESQGVVRVAAIGPATRMLFINSKSSAPAFFAQSKSRRAHRIYIGMLYTWKR